LRINNLGIMRDVRVWHTRSHLWTGKMPA